MIEYLHNAIRATAGADIEIVSKVTEDSEPVLGVCFMLHTDETKMLAFPGELIDGIYKFIIPADVTKGLSGRYEYCLAKENQPLCFKEPIYFV